MGVINYKNGDKMKLSLDHSTVLNIGLSVLVFMHWSKNQT